MCALHPGSQPPTKHPTLFLVYSSHIHPNLFSFASASLHAASEFGDSATRVRHHTCSTSGRPSAAAADSRRHRPSSFPRSGSTSPPFDRSLLAPRFARDSNDFASSFVATFVRSRSRLTDRFVAPSVGQPCSAPAWWHITEADRRLLSTTRPASPLAGHRNGHES